MNTDNYYYRLNREQRDRLLRAAQKERLIRIAIERAPKSHKRYVIALMTLAQSLFR
jgi:hypothetical protein